jgi:hypothetical protein
MFVVYMIIVYIRVGTAILVTNDNRISSRNLTCQHGSLSASSIAFNCEACLLTSRNYAINTTLSITGSGPSGITYVCLKVNDIDAYHKNLVDECRYFPRDTLNGYDDFCIASPYSLVRGSYRACICLSNICNVNHTQCIQLNNPHRDGIVPLFKNTLVSLVRRIHCYHSAEHDRPPIYSSLTPLCTLDDDICNSYVFDHSVLCVINIDQRNQITRESLPSSVYAFYVLKFKIDLCRSFTSNSLSISFSACQQENTVCMCAQDQCNQNLETCRMNQGVTNDFTVYIYWLLLVLIGNI